VSARRVLVAGIGNVFSSDDGFGVEVVQHLLRRTWPEGVSVQDVGIRGVHLAYQLLDGYDLLVLVDAVASGDPPGTLTVFEPILEPTPEASPENAGLGLAMRGAAAAQSLDSHGMEPAVVLSLARRLGAPLGRVVVVGCVPLTVDDGLGLSEPVAAAVPLAVAAVADLVAADLGAAELGAADLVAADLGAAELGAADLVAAELGAAELGGAEPDDTDLVSAELLGAQSPGAAEAVVCSAEAELQEVRP